MARKRPDQQSFRHAWISLNELRIHPRVQRNFRKAWAQQIADNFDPDVFGEVYVNQDGNGYYWVWDGQHRVWAARQVLGEDQQVYCRVYESTAQSELAERSLLLNSQKPWSQIDRFMLRVMAKEVRALTISGQLNQFGLRVHRCRGKGVVQAVAACDWIMDRMGGAPGLGRTLRILYSAWGDDPDAYNNSLLRGTALVCERYDGKLDDKELSEKLAKSGTAGQMIGAARGWNKSLGRGESVAQAAAMVITREYNKGRRSGRLPNH